MLNDTDKNLIALLRINARTPLSTLAKKLNVSRTTVQNRLERLESSGLITGYTVTLKPTTAQADVNALVFLSINGQHEEKLIERLRGYPSVLEIHGTNGRWDLVLNVRTNHLATFNDLLLHIRKLPAVLNTETTLLLASYKA